MFYIYIIESSSYGTYYVGCTDNVSRRFEEHTNNQSAYTKNKGPWILKHTEEYQSLSEARKREKQIKGWKSRKSIERLWK